MNLVGRGGHNEADASLSLRPTHVSREHELDRYGNQEKIRYGLEEKTTREELMAVRSFLIEAKSRFPAIGEGLLKASIS